MKILRLDTTLNSFKENKENTWIKLDNITEEIKEFWWIILNIFLWTKNKTQENLVNKSNFEDKIRKQEEKEKEEEEEEKKRKEEIKYYTNLSKEEESKIIKWDNLVEKMRLASISMKNLESFQ